MCYKLNFILFSLLLIALQGCIEDINRKDTNKAGQNLTSNSNQTELKFVGQWYGQGKRERLVREFAQEYGFLHQDLKITLKFPEEIFNDKRGTNSLRDFISTAIKSEKPEWDILLINNNPGLYSNVANEPDWPKKYLIDFSEIEGFKDATVPDIITDSLKNLWHGIIPGPVIEGFNYALWTNLSVAKKIGINVKQFDMTFDDFLGYIKAVHEYNQSHKNDYIIPIYETKDWANIPAITNQLFASELDDRTEFFADHASERKLQAWYKTLKALEKLSAYQPLCPKWDTMVWNNNYQLMLKDKCLFFSNGSWMYSFWQAKDSSKIKNIMPAEYPVFKPVNTYIGGYQIVWAVPKNAPHKDEAIKFLLAMNNAKVAEKWVRYTKCPTGIKGKLASVSMGVDHFEDFTTQIQKKYGMSKISFNASSTYILGKQERWNKNFYLEVLQGSITPEEAMKNIRNDLKNHKVRILK